MKPSSLIQLTLITVSTCLLATSVEAQTLHPFAGGGDGLAATEAALWTPRGLLVGNDRSLYIAEFNGNRVRRVAPDGTITTIAGGGQLFPLQVPATDANLIQTAAIAFDSDGLAYISHTSVSEISRIDADGIIEPAYGGGFGFPGPGIYPGRGPRSNTTRARVGRKARRGGRRRCGSWSDPPRESCHSHSGGHGVHRRF